MHQLGELVMEPRDGLWLVVGWGSKSKLISVAGVFALFFSSFLFYRAGFFRLLSLTLS